METHVLIGAEDVRRAAGEMTAAAREMNGAAARMEYALQAHERFLDDWLLRYQAATGREHDPLDT